MSCQGNEQWQTAPWCSECVSVKKEKPGNEEELSREGARLEPLILNPCDPCLPARFQVPKALQHPKSLPLAEDQLFKHMSLWRIFHRSIALHVDYVKCNINVNFST